MRITSFHSGALALTALVGLTACATTNQSAGLRQVDDLVGHVELTHLEAELTRQQVYDTLGKLHVLLSPGERTDPLVAYEAFAVSVETCGERSEAFRMQREPMDSAAKTVFGRWESSLEEFQGEAMRTRSEARMNAARERYQAVRDSAVQAQEEFDAFHAGMQDIALFLGHDFNPSSTKEIEGDARTLAGHAKELRETLHTCMQFAEVYIREAAPLGHIEVISVEDKAPSSQTKTPNSRSPKPRTVPRN
tara:strand:- start:13855 stop:14601 length:747 start_codon:yes stop_codon:yes gene_type:complete